MAKRRHNPPAVKVPTTGPCVNVRPQNGFVFTMAEMRQLIDARYLIFRMLRPENSPGHRTLMVMDEEGLLHNKPLNWRATILAFGGPTTVEEVCAATARRRPTFRLLQGMLSAFGDVIVGDVLLLDPAELPND